MSVLALLLSLGLAVTIGYCALWIAWPKPAAGAWTRLARFGLAAGLGLGITSILYFLWLLLVGPFAPGLWALEVVLAVGSMALGWRRRYANEDEDEDENEEVEQEVGVGAGVFARVVRWGLGSVVGLLAVHWILSFAALTGASPHGRWDAWMIWNLRARFLFRSGVEWETAFSPLLAWTHLDYPLLVPGAIARLWTEIGSDPALGSILVAGTFGLATAALLVGTVGCLRGPGQALVAGTFLLATEAFVGQSAAQNADVPLGFFYLAALSALALALRYPERPRRLVMLAGVAAGLGAWTKNEGFVFIAALVLVWLVVALRSRDPRSRLAELAALGAGMLPTLLVVAAFKVMLAPPNDILTTMSLAGTLERLTDPDRILYVVSRFGAGVIGYGRSVVSAPVMLVLYGLLAGVGASERAAMETPGIRIRIAATTALMYLAYLAIYVLTPHDLAWHLDTSLRRLLQQLWPSALLAFFLFVRTPEELAGRLRRHEPATAEA